ncbi:MAG TPA: Trm112 family protein [Candidatus Polarisedimenticolia bacterium]|nr:Trm112 family protein [Candidatus Polarisedimenticolia bacterium]
MAIDPELIEILACPACRTEVEPTPDGTALFCHSCRRRYAIVDDIPIMLIEEATIEPEDDPHGPGQSPRAT